MGKSLSPGDTILVLIVTGSIIFFCLSIFIGIILLAYQRRQLQNKQETSMLSARYEKELMQTQLEFQNFTLQQIGQELHDNIGQLLSVAKINLNILEDIDRDPESQGYIQQTNEIIGQSIIDLRLLTKSFDGDFVKDFGLENSLSHELLRIRKTKKYQTELNVSGGRYTLGYEKEIVLFRIAQEVLNNIMKHANATKINAMLTYESEKFTLCIKDNGKGFDPKLIKDWDLRHSGSGLRNIKRRTEMIGGSFFLETNSHSGTKIELQLTLNKRF